MPLKVVSDDSDATRRQNECVRWFVANRCIGMTGDTRTLSLGTLLIVFSGRSTRRTRSDLIDVRFFPAPATPALPELPSDLSQKSEIPLYGCEVKSKVVQLRYSYNSTSIRPPFDSHSTAIRPRYDHSTTYVTTSDVVWDRRSQDKTGLRRKNRS